MAMSPEAQTEYNRAMAAAATQHGTVVSSDASFYGWGDWEAMEHLNPYGAGATPCRLIAPEHGTVKEDRWDEFEGTFYEGDTTHHGVIVTGVSCACGHLTDRTVRWEASMQEVAEAIFEIAFGPKAPPRTF